MVFGIALAFSVTLSALIRGLLSESYQILLLLVRVFRFHLKKCSEKERKHVFP